METQRGQSKAINTALVREYSLRSGASRAVLTILGRIDGRGLHRSVSYFYYPTIVSPLCLFCTFFHILTTPTRRSKNQNERTGK